MVKPVVPRESHIRVVANTKFIQRVNRICRRLGHVKVSDPPAMTDNVLANRRAVGAWFGEVHGALRHARHRLVGLGQPSKNRAGWQGVINKLRAMEAHIDTMRAAAWVGNVQLLRLDARELKRSNKSVDRRLRRFGVKHC